MSALQSHQQEQIANQNQHPLANYQFSSDELRVLRECNTESFFQRSLPFGTAFGLGAYFGVKQGYFRSNIKYGAVPKVVVSVVMGYFLGKFSYQQKCAEKIMRLPNSKLGEVLRQKQKGGLYSVLTPDKSIGTGMALSAFAPNNADLYTDDNTMYDKSNSLELDADSRPAISGLDDTYRPTLDDPSPQFGTDLPLIPTKQNVTYDELRMKNREEYAKKMQNPTYSPPLPSGAPVIKRMPEITDGFDIQGQVQGQRNKYGDTWTN